MRKLIHSDDLPGVSGMLLKSLFQKPSPHLCLPEHQLHCQKLSPDPQHVRDYHRLMGWKEANRLHPAYIHVLAMPLHLSLLLDQGFPFRLTGLIHVENHIQQIRGVEPQEELDLICYLADLTMHHKGWQFSVVTQAWSKHQLVWQETSVNLALKDHGKTVGRLQRPQIDYSLEPIDWFPFSAGAGREYSKLSGDFNPIHLWTWSAKLFGFRRQILHGMYSLGICLTSMSSVLQKKDEFKGSIRFRQPLYLPAETRLSADISAGYFCLKSADNQTLYLEGECQL